MLEIDIKSDSTQDYRKYVIASYSHHKEMEFAGKNMGDGGSGSRAHLLSLRNSAGLRKSSINLSCSPGKSSLIPSGSNMADVNPNATEDYNMIYYLDSTINAPLGNFGVHQRSEHRETILFATFGKWPIDD